VPETYFPIQWRNDQTPAINENNLNRIEQGVEAIDVRAARLELGVATAVTVPYASSVVLNATQGSLFRCAAVGDLTLDNIVGGIDGQMITFVVKASGASRTLSFTGDAESTVIASGTRWTGRFIYDIEDDTWTLL
jgi:hypothetical protein